MIKSKKYVLVALLLFVASLCLLLGMTNLGSVKSANADGSFVMESGASVRLVPGESGIRFLAKVPEPTQYSDREYRMLIVPEKLLTDKKIENDFVNKLKANYPEQAANWDVNFWDKAVTPYYHKQLSTYVVSGALGVSDAHHNIKFCGIAYYMDGNNYVYASYNEAETIFDNARSISLTASLVLNEDIGYNTDEKDILRNYVSSALSSEKFTFSSEFVSAKINSVIDAKLNTISDLDVQYEVGDENIASVENGVITMIGHGSTTVTATIGDQFSTSITVDCPTMNQVLMDATAKSKQINQYYVMESVATEADANAPEGFKDGLKYVITPTEVVGSGNYYGFPVSLNKNNTKSSAYNDFFSVTDWSNAYVTFKVYNAGTVPVKIGLVKGMTGDTHHTMSSENLTVNVDEEKVVYFSIKDAMGLTGSPFDTEDFKAGRGFNIQTLNAINSLTAGTLVNGAQTLYITDFDIFTPDSTDAMLVRDKKNSEITSQTINRDKTYILEGNTSARFVYNNDGWNGEWYYLTPSDTANYTISSWENVFVSFYVYSTDVLRFNFRYSVDKEEQVQTNVAGEWTKITCSLRELGITSIDGLNSPILRCRVATSIRAEYTFYVDKFMVESRVLSEMEDGSLDSSLALAIGDANCEAIVSSEEKYGEISIGSIQYTFTNNGTTYDEQQDGSYTGRIILDDESILFNNCNVTDWSTAYVRFYIKNTTGYDVRLAPRFQTATGEGTDKQWKGTVLKYEWWQHKAVDISKSTTDWTLVEVSLADIAASCTPISGTTKGDYYKENVTDFKFCLAVCIKIPQGNSVSFYIDGISIYNK